MKDRIIPVGVFAVITLILISPILNNIDNVGLSDWDQHLFYHAVPIKAIKTYWQFPLWNPYYCGGNVLLANPQSLFLAPTFVFALIFGELIGLKIIIGIYGIIGMFGMFFLSRVLKFEYYSSFLPPLIFILSSWYALRVTAGHTTFFPFTLLPYVVAFYIKSLKQHSNNKSLVVCALFLTWMFFGGGVYPLILTGIFLFSFSSLTALSKQSMKPLINMGITVGLTFCLSAIKVIPVYEFTSQFPRKTSAKQFHSLALLKKALFSRNQGIMTQEKIFYSGGGSGKEELRKIWIGAKPWGWHEYGAFIGISSFLLYLLGFALYKKTWIWLTISLILLLFSLGDYSPVNIWAILHHLPLFSSLHGPSRITPIFIFTLSIIAGFTVNSLQSRAVFQGVKFNSGTLAIGIMIVVFLELISVTRPVFKDAFTEPPPQIKKNRLFQQMVAENPTRSNYEFFLNNKGVVNCYDTVHPPIKAMPYGDERGQLNPYYKAEAYLLSGRPVAINFFSTNRVELTVDAADNDTLVLNQNYFNGWHAEAGQENILSGDVKSYNGLISVPLLQGKSKVSFFYSPLSFKIGLVISVLSFTMSLIYLRFGIKFGVFKKSEFLKSSG